MKQDVALDKIKSETDAETQIRYEVESLYLSVEIGKLRQRHRLTLHNVSDLYGLSKSLLSQIESETKAPDYQYAEKAFLYIQGGGSELKTEGEQDLLIPADNLYLKSNTPGLVRIGDDLTQSFYHSYRTTRWVINHQTLEEEECKCEELFVC